MSSDEGEGFIPFEVTGDDVESGLGGRRRRPTRRDNIYGVFGGGSDSDGEDNDASGSKSYRRPVSFVSSAKDKPDDEGAGGDSESDMDVDEVLQRVMNKDASNEKPQQEVSKTKPRSTFVRSGEKQPAANVPEQANGPSSVAAAAQDTVSAPKDNLPAEGAASAGTSEGAPASSSASATGYSMFQRRSMSSREKKEIGNWTKFTSGIGMKLLKKSGWKEGEGLGKKKHGIAEPIQVKLRKRNQGLQDKGERTAQSRRDFAAAEEGDAEGAEHTAMADYAQQWRRGAGRGREARPKYSYKTAEELAAEATPRDSSAAGGGLKIIDMTGKKARVVTDLRGSSRHTTKQKVSEDEVAGEDGIFRSDDGSVPMPELQHNINVLVETAATDIVRINGQLKRDRRNISHLTDDVKEMEERLVHESKRIERLEGLLDMLDICQGRVDSADSPMSADECRHFILQLRTKYQQEFQAYRLGDYAAAMAFPLLSQELQGWQPLQQPQAHHSSFEQWRDLLDIVDSHVESNIVNGHQPSNYDKLCWNVLLPHLRAAITQTWSPRQPDQLIAFLKQWRSILSSWVTQNIYDQLVMPRLQREVELWDPRTDPVPVHAWIHPWLPLMEEQLHHLYPAIRYKLGSCLQMWNPADMSALAMIKPWGGVFRPSDMAVFLSRSIVPKLQQALSSFVINPQHQGGLDLFRAVVKWDGLLPAGAMAHMLAEYFFPKFLRVLCQWLMMPNANYEELIKWYSGWKGMLGKDLVSQDEVEGQLRRALALMRAVATEPDRGKKTLEDFVARLNLQASAPRGWASAGQPGPVPIHPVHGAASTVQEAPASAPSTVRQLVEHMALQQGVLFAPKPGWHTQGGIQMYTCGKATVYIDRDVLFMKQPNKDGREEFVPVSLDELMDKCQ